MRLHYKNEHTSCMNYKTEAYKGFVLGNMSVGDTLTYGISSSIRSNYLLFILDGEVEVQTDKNELLRVRSGEFFFIPCHLKYNISILKSGTYICLNFIYNNIQLCDKEKIESYLSEGLIYSTQFRSLKSNKLLKSFLDGMRYYMEAGINCSHLHDIKEKELMLIIRASYSKKSVLELFHPILGSNISFKESVLLLSDTIFNRTDLATQLNMSVTDLDRKFKEEFNESVHAWMLKHRDKRILERVTSSSVTVKEIVHEFGFSSGSNFNRYCKSHFGCTPKELIKIRRE